MPTIANATVIGHLYREPATGKTKDDKQWARFSLWTSDKIKPRDGGEAEKKFSSWSGVISGPQADWLIRDGKKGSLVAVTGTIRIDSHADKDGKIHATGEFTRVQEVRVLDAREDGAPEQAAPRPAKTAAAPSGGGSDAEPPFNRFEDWSW